MTRFGDFEPDDAWDRDDPVEVLADLLRRRLEAVGLHVGEIGTVDAGEQLEWLATVAADGIESGAVTSNSRLAGIVADLDVVTARAATET